MKKNKVISQMFATLTLIGLMNCFNSKAANLETYDLIKDNKLDIFDMIEMREEVIKGNKTIAQAVELERFLLGMETVIDINSWTATEENIENFKIIFENCKFIGVENTSLFTLNYTFENNIETIVLKSKDKMPTEVDELLYEKIYNDSTEQEKILRLYKEYETDTLFLVYIP